MVTNKYTNVTAFGLNVPILQQTQDTHEQYSKIQIFLMKSICMLLVNMLLQKTIKLDMFGPQCGNKR